ncbi:hypothetical protein QJQ45_005996 [Haematococcus lacustris]|nr:hypothetical protein QJQ45_005996 [Haematococcus lacustris]
MAPHLPAKHWQTFRMPSQPAETLDELATLAHNQLAQGLVDEARATFQRLAVAQAEVLTAKAAQLLLRDETDVAARGSVPCSSSGALCSCTAQPKPATAPAHTEAIATATTCDVDDDVADDWESCDVASFAQAPVPVSTSLNTSNLPSSAVSQGSRQPGFQAAVSDQDQAWAAAVGLGPLTQAPLPGRGFPSSSSRGRQGHGSEHQEEGGSLSGVIWEGGFSHCVEVCDLTPATITSTLQAFLDVVLPDAPLQPYIRWADDKHAVLVCPNATMAQELLALGASEGWQLREWEQASQASKQLPVAELLPPKPRPKTSSAVARKLLSHALAMPQLRDRAAEQQLAAARRSAREERRIARELAEQVWEG